MFVLPGIEMDIYMAEALIGLATGFHRKEKDQNRAILALTEEGLFARKRSRAAVLFLFDTERRKRILALIGNTEERKAAECSVLEIEQEIDEQNKRVKELLPRINELRITLQAAIDKETDGSRLL